MTTKIKLSLLVGVSFALAATPALAQTVPSATPDGGLFADSGFVADVTPPTIANENVVPGVSYDSVSTQTGTANYVDGFILENVDTVNGVNVLGVAQGTFNRDERTVTNVDLVVPANTVTNAPTYTNTGNTTTDLNVFGSASTGTAITSTVISTVDSTAVGAGDDTVDVTQTVSSIDASGITFASYSGTATYNVDLANPLNGDISVSFNPVMTSGTTLDQNGLNTTGTVVAGTSVTTPLVTSTTGTLDLNAGGPSYVQVNTDSVVLHGGNSSTNVTINNNGITVVDTTVPSGQTFRLDEFGNVSNLANNTVGGNLQVNGAGDVNGNFNVDGFTTTNGQDNTGGLETDTLLVNNTSQFNGLATFTAGVNVTGGTTTDTLLVTGNSQMLGNLDVQGFTTTNGVDNNGNLETDTLQVNSNANVSGNLDVAGFTNLNGGLQVSGGSTLNGGTTMNGGATVNGLLTANNGAVVNNGFTANGGSTLNGGATVNGLLTANNGLAVVGGANIANGLVVTGGSTLSGGATVNGLFTANNGSVLNGGTTMNGGATVNGNAQFNNNVTVVGSTNTNGISNTGNIVNSGNIATGSLNVSGATVTNGITNTGNIATTTLTTTGNASVGGSLAVAGNSAVTGNSTVGGTLAVTGATTLTGLLTANGGVSTTTLTTSGNATIGGDVAVTGNYATTNGNITTTNGTISGASLVSTGTTSVGTNLTVGGTSDFRGAIFNGGTANGGALYVNDALTVTGEVAVGTIRMSPTTNKISGLANATLSGTSTEAVTGQQLFATNNALAALDAREAAHFSLLMKRADKAYQGVAMGFASNAAPLNLDNGEGGISAGVGVFQGEWAGAIRAQYVTDSGVGVGVNFGFSEDAVGGGVGASIKF